VQTIGSPRTLKDVLTITGHPVSRQKASRFEAQPGELWITTMQGDVRAKVMEKDWRPLK
jgi:hypothetical protein